MIENLKIGCTVSKDQLSRIPIEGLTADNVLDELDFGCWFVEYDQDGQPMREAFEDAADATSRYGELKTWEEFDAMKGLIDSISDWGDVAGATKND